MLVTGNQKGTRKKRLRVVRAMQKRLYLKKLKDPATAKEVGKTDLSRTSNIPNTPAGLYLEAIKTIWDHSKEQKGSNLKVLNRGLHILNNNKKVLFTSFINLIKSTPALLGSKDLIDEVNRLMKIDFLNANFEELSKLTLEERFAYKVAEKLRKTRRLNELLNLAIKAEPNLTAENGLSQLPNKAGSILELSIGSVITVIGMVSKKPQHLDESIDHSKLAFAFEKYGVCDLLKDSMREFQTTLRLRTGRPITRSELKLSANMLRKVNNFLANALLLKNRISSFGI